MRIVDVTCPRCGQHTATDSGLWRIGTVRLRCVACRNAFLPPDSPRDRTMEQVANASVPLTIWEPAADAPEESDG